MNRYILAAALALVAQAATADEITLKAITAFAEGTTYSRPFERFIQRAIQQEIHETVRLRLPVLSFPQLLHHSQLLCARGFGDTAAAKRFLRPRFDQLHDPMTMLGLDDAVERLVTAIGRNETIVVHGDYDVDGMASTALLMRALQAVGGRVVPFVPRRIGIRASDQRTPVRGPSIAVPNLLPVDTVMIAIQLRRCAHISQIRTGIRFGKSLAPDLVPAQDIREEAFLLPLGSKRDDRRTDQTQT